MFAKIENWLTLGGQYVAAAVVYLGIALILSGSTLLDSPLALAAAGSSSDCSHVAYEYHEGEWTPVTRDGCPDGQQCCGGECISEDYICCEDGTYGDAETCECLCCDDDCGPEGTTTIICD